MSEHCWHSDGYTTVTAMAGPNAGGGRVICCYCGKSASRTFHEEDRPAEGHGKFSAIRTRIYAAVVAEFLCVERQLAGEPPL